MSRWFIHFNGSIIQGRIQHLKRSCWQKVPSKLFVWNSTVTKFTLPTFAPSIILPTFGSKHHIKLQIRTRQLKYYVRLIYLIAKQKWKIKDNCVINDIKVFMEFKVLYQRMLWFKFSMRKKCKNTKFFRVFIFRSPFRSVNLRIQIEYRKT